MGKNAHNRLYLKSFKAIKKCFGQIKHVGTPGYYVILYSTKVTIF